MSQATAAEFQRGFGKFRMLAQREPLVVTSHGRPDIVVLSADEYRRLKRLDRVAIRSADMPDETLALLDLQVIPSEARAFDHEVE